MRVPTKVLLLLFVAVVLRPQEAPAPQAPPLVYQHRPLQVPIACRADDFEAAGLECSEGEPCRLFLELTAVEAWGPKILLVGNIHTTMATLSSIALLSQDAGATWREPLKRLAATGFEAVQFLSEQQGWIAAQPQGQLATDPYFLATPDGGANWQKLPIWSEEGRSGLLQQFHFDNKDHGFALIDRPEAGPGAGRYELYETLNGGGSWMLRETSSRPITPKWSARPTADWRLREDGKLKTYELERRVGANWQRMANFRTELGICKALESSRQPASPPLEQQARW